MLSVHFNIHFPVGPGLASTVMSPIWILLVLTMTNMLVTTGAISRAKLQSNHHQQQTNIQFLLKAACLPVTNSVRAVKEKLVSLSVPQ